MRCIRPGLPRGGDQKQPHWIKAADDGESAVQISLLSGKK